MGIFAKDQPANELSQALRDEQERRGLTRVELAEELKSSRSLFIRLELKGYMMSDRTYKKLADFIGVDIKDAVAMRFNEIDDETDQK